MAHPHHLHREHQVGHRRVHHILKGEPSGAKQHNDGGAFSKVTSKTAAEHHDGHVEGKGAPKRFARGGKVKGHKHETNVNIMMPQHRPAAPPMLPAGPPPGPPGGPPPMGGPGLPPPGGPPGMPPGMPPPGMHARGGRVRKAGGGSTSSPPTKPPLSPIKPDTQSNRDYDAIKARNWASGGKVHDGESTKANVKKWGKHAKDNSYARGGAAKMTAGAATGVGRLEQEHHMKHKGKK